MSSKSNITDNRNFLAPGNFKVTIDSSEYANLQFFCTSASVPSLSQTPVATGYKNFNASVPGDTVNYSELNLTFVVDEEMKNYLEIHDWMLENNSSKPKYKDILLSIQTNKNTLNKQVRFHDAFPISLDTLSFTTQDVSVEYIQCSVTFSYNKFTFVR